MQKITSVDIFAGVGGMRIALEQSALRKKIYHKCLLACEIDKNCKEVYQQNFLDCDFLDDINKINKKNIHSIIPNHDILMAGFPCQPFSSAGVVVRNFLNRSHGFKDKNQGNLIFKLIEILKLKKTKAFVLENVRNLARHDNGKTLEIILKELRKHFYVPDPKILNAKDFGLPQSRERIYIVGFLKRKHENFLFPKSINKKTLIKDILEKQVNKSFTISNKLWQGHINRKKRNLLNGRGFGFKLSKPKDPFTRTITSRYAKDGSECLIYQTGKKNPRFLTPRECFRLQGFPENFKISRFKTHAYQQAGNSVPVNVVTKICDSILDYLLVHKKISIGKVA